MSSLNISNYLLSVLYPFKKKFKTFVPYMLFHRTKFENKIYFLVMVVSLVFSSVWHIVGSNYL